MPVVDRLFVTPDHTWREGPKSSPAVVQFAGQLPLHFASAVMPYKSSTATTNKGFAADTGSSRLATASKRYNDGDLGDESVLTRGPQPAAFPSFTMTTRPQNGGGHKLSLSRNRRQSSIPNAKFSVGPRILELQNNQRSISGSAAQHFGSLRGTPVTESDPSYSHDLSIDDVSQFSFASIDPTNTVPRSQQEEDEDAQQMERFLEPNFDFDTFHDNIVATSPRLDTFAIPGLSHEFAVSDVPELPKVEPRKFPHQPAIPIPARKLSAAAGLHRKGSGASTRSRLSISKLDPMSQPTSATSSVLRGRRQTQFPPTAYSMPMPTAVTKAPRKSVGPGTFVLPDTDEQPPNKRRPSVNGPKSGLENGRLGVSTRSLMQGNESGRDTSKSPNTLRVKSMYNTNRQSAKDLFTPSKTPEGLRTTSFHVQTTPNWRSGTPGRTTTPGANNRRQSVATGLGARTISPTDARRLKRMSMVPPAPPLPAHRISQAPPTPQPDLILPVLPPNATATTQRKSMTPSSSRTTPDPNRKSYSSGQSLSSNTTYGSIRNSTSISAKLAHQNNNSSSRLSTPKPRTETGNSPSEEEIPPVPAIPKSYESPASEIDQPFFSARSSSLQHIDTPTSDSIGVVAAEAFARLNLPEDFNDSLLFTEAEWASEPRPRKAFDQMDLSGRVPPLGVVPLNTPTTDKIKAFKGPLDSRTAVTPDACPKIKTPSTPMTASKAVLFNKTGKGMADNAHSKIVRSTTSHFVVRSGVSSTQDGLSPSLPTFTFENDTSSHRSVSPYLSSSAPKDSHEFPNYMRPNFTTESRRNGAQARPNGPRAPSYSIPVKVNDTTALSGKSSDNSASTSTSLIPRTINKKQIEGNDTETKTATAEPNKSDRMPPPRLPASATWTNLSTNAPSPSQKISFFKSRRKTSASSGITLSGSNMERHESSDSGKASIHTGRPSVDSMRSLMTQPNKSTSLLVPSKSVQGSNQEIELDRDDLVAEEEMKKLASKRRDFESAARQLDALRARARPVDRVSPNTALHTLNLNIFERGEIVDFPDIYFTGTKGAKKVIGDLASTASNFGYDDDRGDYNIIEGDHLAYRYEVVDVLGKGSFGQVVRCVDHKTGILVAIKIIRNKKRFHQQALVEVEILQKLKEWDPDKQYNVVNFDQSFYFRGHLCISTDLLNMNLYELIKAHDFRGFSLKVIRRFTKQMLQSLILLHGKKVIHCDLKPENILLAHPARSEIKVIDFGSSCFENEKVYTYIQSRFYRSPEVILGMSYGMPIDMWSLGCILAELYTGYPIFPGENEQEQLACIMEIFGPPEKQLIEKSSRKKLFFDSMGKPRLTVSSKGRRRRPSSKDLRTVLKCDDEAFLDFIARCLRWDPTRRINPHDACKHEFITGMRPAPISTRKHIANALSTPLKRGNSIAIAASTGIRPLPQPPSSNLKPVIGVRQDSLAASPNKPGARRQSTVNAGSNGIPQAKRAAHAVTSSTSKLVSGRRTAGSRTDLATAAAAAASLVK